MTQKVDGFIRPTQTLGKNGGLLQSGIREMVQRVSNANLNGLGQHAKYCPMASKAGQSVSGQVSIAEGVYAQLLAEEGAGLWVCTTSQEPAEEQAYGQTQPQARPTDPSPGSIFSGPDSFPTALPWSSNSTLRLSARSARQLSV